MIVIVQFGFGFLLLHLTQILQRSYTQHLVQNFHIFCTPSHCLKIPLLLDLSATQVTRVRVACGSHIPWLHFSLPRQVSLCGT